MFVADGHQQSLSFTTADDDISVGTAWAQIDAGMCGSSVRRGGPQVGGVFLTSDASSGEATIAVALVRRGVVLAVFTATVTPTSRRAAVDMGGSTGGYVCDVEFDITGNHKFDLLGSYEGNGGKWGPGLAGNDEGAGWMIGVLSMTTITELTGLLVTSPEAG